jgi:hypothetical protein
LLALAKSAAAGGASVVAARTPPLVDVPVRDLVRPKRWRRTTYGVEMAGAGEMAIGFSVAQAGTWDLSLVGEFAPAITLRLDGRRLGSLSGELGGDSVVPNVAAPLHVHLSAGTHLLVVARGSARLAPGDGGSALLDRVYVSPADAPARTLVTLSPRALRAPSCATAYAWVELLARS